MRKSLSMGAAILVAALWASSAFAQLTWRIEESDSSHLQVLLEARGAKLVPSGDDTSAQSWQEVRLSGAHLAGAPGMPMLPGAARWLALPPTGDARLEVEVLSRELLGRARLRPGLTPSLDPEGFDGEPRLLERPIESPDYESFHTDTASVVRLGNAVFQRRQRIAPLQVSPVIYDAASGRVEIVTSMRVTIRFPRSPSAGFAAEQSVAGAVSGLLNPTVARQWSCLEPTLARRKQIWAESALGGLRKKIAHIPVFDPSALLGPEIRVRVEDSGLHRVQMSEILSRFDFPADALRKNIRLFQKRPSDPDSLGYPAPLTVEVPLHFLGNPDPDAAISSTDVLLFYGLSAEDDWKTRDLGDDVTLPTAMPLGGPRPDSFNSSNVYWLAAMDPGAGSWARMSTDSLGLSQGSPESQFRSRRTFSGDAAYKEDLPNPRLERYYWNDWDNVTVERTVPLFSAVQDSMVRLRWRFVGSTRVMGTGTPRPVDFYVDGLAGTIPIGSFNSDSFNYDHLDSLEVSLPASDLDDGFLTFGMEHLEGGSRSRVGAYLASVTVDYASRYRAAFDDLTFTAGRAGVDVDLEVVGFDRPDLLLFDVTDPENPRFIDVSSNVVGQDGVYSLSLHVSQAPGVLRRFRVSPLQRVDIIRNQNLEEDPVPSVFDSADDLQVLAVGPEFLSDTMQSWVQWRTTHDLGYGWKVGYVDVQQIYDDFSGGLQSPQAIHDFVEYAYTEWNATALLLVGDANEDARGVGVDAGVNLVPPSLHSQRFLAGTYELLASDKWYGLMHPASSYPTSLDRTSDLLVGRLPAHQPADLQVMLDKIYAYEQPRVTDAWRGQSYWIADDAYSSRYLGAAQGAYEYQPQEEKFGQSQQRAAMTDSTSLDGMQRAVYFNIDEVTAGCRADLCSDRLTRGCVAGCFSTRGTGRVIDSLSEGWLIASYQGHAAFNVLAHEGMLQRNGLTGLTNNGRPFIFFGMGCHVSDFLQWEEGRVGSPIGEYIVTLPERGAIASYGSSGFEFLDQNAAYMEEIADVFFRDGRVQGMVGGPLRSQWILGEVLAQSELNGVALPLAFGASEMVAQYNLLGDPLLRVDALPPRLRVGGAQGTLEEGADLQADTGSGVAALTVDAVDETGISHLDIVDSKGRDESGLVQWSTGVDPRRRAANLELPILPQTYDVEFSLFDGSYPRTRPTTLTLHVQLGSEFFVDGEPFDALAGAGFPVGRTVSVELRLNSPVDLTPSDIGTVSLEGGSVGTVSATGSGRQWTLNFDVTAESETGQRLSVELGSVTEEYPLSSGPGGGGRLYVESHFPYPNPARLDGGSSISVVARASEAVQWARLVIYDLSGRLVYQRRDDSLFVSDRDFSLRWDGRTRDGHEVANGTYFYRLEVGAGTRTARSDMGRIVVMR